MNYNDFVQNLSDGLLDKLPYEKVCALRRSTPKDRIGKDILLPGDEMDRFLECFEETFGFIPAAPSPRQLVSMDDLHNAVAKL